MVKKDRKIRSLKKEVKGTHSKSEKILISWGPTKMDSGPFFMMALNGSELKKVTFALPSFFRAHRRVYDGRASTLHAQRSIYPEQVTSGGRAKACFLSWGPYDSTVKNNFTSNFFTPELIFSTFHQNSVSPCVPLNNIIFDEVSSSFFIFF